MMQQDPKKGAKDYEKPSVKQKLAQSSSKKKVGVGEMGKPDLKAGFEAAMQKERNTVLDRAKKSEDFSEWAKKESIRSARESQNRDIRSGFIKIKENMAPNMPKEDIERYIKSVVPSKKPLKSMSKPKGKY
jgi:hypothetical protein